MAKEFGNKDQKEKSRTLTEAEKKRLENFNVLTDSMVAAGYKKTELTVGIVGANIFAIILLIPLSAVGIWLFILKNKTINFTQLSLSDYLLFLGIFLILIVVHELIHGLSWSVFTKDHFKDIEFGIMWQYLTPYCTCKVPLLKGQYIFGAVMPLVALGILPMIIGILINSFPTLIMGILMADSAAGDILIIWNILRYKSNAKDIVYIDHPTQAGGVIFEK